ncbi:MAG: energy transducer TonB [Gammaproteobacteria bacterium TMED1]|nr:MAG: energy transducer TonB [Gammaproteobacteria bacterium TMED1]|tara:strand:+ start:456 stop:1346 length:891 start_codon:yes stop_codon:yes gene_type:complete
MTDNQVQNTGDTSSLDRLIFTSFLAVTVHAMIILGVTFTSENRASSTHTMEITLAQHRSLVHPEETDFLAQFNQLGSGTLEEKKLLRSPEQSRFFDTEIRDIREVTTKTKTIQNLQPELATVIDTQNNYRLKTIRNETKSESKEQVQLSQIESSRRRSHEIASLEARLEKQRAIHAKRPRIKRLTSLSAAYSIDASYLDSWRRDIERIGNINYPEKARQEKLYGSLRLLVAILPDGELKEVRMLESSGQTVLDDAALNIVTLAAPFAPFPEELRETTDVLEIIRTWRFQQNRIQSF